MPPVGPPPSRTSNISYAPPPGPPPSHSRQGGYAPPPGPPPNHGSYEAPPGPPPNYADPHTDPTTNDDWKVIPDTSLLPPPPAAGHDYGSQSNADATDADRAHDWCKDNPLIPPHRPSQAQLQAVQSGDVRIMKPVEYRGDITMPSTGTWRASTRSGSADSCLISSSPLYFALVDAPSRIGLKKTIYYEIEMLSLGQGRRNEECAVAIGYCTVPYPTWRMPGWERGSLAIHSDDGRRYVNDTWGGKDFTSPVETGDIVGLGITLTLSANASNPPNPPGYDSAPAQSTRGLDAEVFFIRNGQKDGGWNLHEELDQYDKSVEGLDGTFDLYAAIGVYGGADFEVRFRRDTWSWLPR